MRLGLPYTFTLASLAIPAVSILIVFLAYTSQYLFYYVEPGPLNQSEAAWFNFFVCAIWWCYARACTVDAAPTGWIAKTVLASEDGDDMTDMKLKKSTAWCKKCAAVKPPRAHHCKVCQRCIPKMDHHCPWTANCVSHTTLPHFVRFVLYAVVSMSILAYHLGVRVYFLWKTRSLPAYLGPPLWGLAHLMVLFVTNSLVLFSLTILLVRVLYGVVINTSTIESWEIERHEALVSRARKTGGYVYANGGQKLWIEHQEFPYDIGFWQNLCQAMGTRNVLMWFMPFGGGPSAISARHWEVNGFEENGKIWPPPDPDKMPQVERQDDRFIRQYSSLEEVKAFKKRQQDDYARGRPGHYTFSDYHFQDKARQEDSDGSYGCEEGIDGKVGWTSSDGDRLRDYGVDEEAEALGDDELPLAELLRRRRANARSKMKVW